ncbi:hypothetical protein [Rubellimicrobium arenae]|uniref:hypothetical protein n=1 Tax=Rubellimicrobium arenae TaxID=2817372 RepID=UPI001FEE735F|nr:hypothetical protein [Rubellimicrobium arenae]
MGLTPGPGHNGGPSLDDGISWRRFAWTQARASLLPTLPIEVVRLRVSRARELGLPYRTYAGIRASTGRDVIGFLFSTNALQLIRPTDVLPRDRRDRLSALTGCQRVALVQHPLDPGQIATTVPLDDAVAAPPPHEPWSATRDRLRAVLRARGMPGDGVVLVAETDLEREWCEMARLAGVLRGDAYFAPLP